MSQLINLVSAASDVEDARRGATDHGRPCWTSRGPSMEGITRVDSDGETICTQCGGKGYVVGSRATRSNQVICQSCGATFYRTGAIRELRGDVDDVLRVHQEVQQATARNFRPNPWITGSFYLATLLLLVAVLLVGGRLVSVWVLPVVAVVGLFGLMTVGALQLRHDDKLSERGFLRLMTTTITKLPALLTRPSRSERGTDLSHDDRNPGT